MISLLVIFDVVVFSSLIYYVRSWMLWRRCNPSGLPYPPGPRGLPLLGNIFDMPEAEEWETARRWGEKYGKIQLVADIIVPHTSLILSR